MIPQHEVRGCLAYYNRARGFYANHHLGGIIFENNTVAASGSNFDMRNRKDGITLPPEDISGYDHIIRNNLSFAGERGSTILEMLNRGKSTVENNSFDLIDVLADGSLPDINFLRLTSDAELRFWGMGCFASNDASKLKFDWLKKPTIVVVGNRASVVGPNADQFTKIYVNKNGEEQEDAYDKRT